MKRDRKLNVEPDIPIPGRRRFVVALNCPTPLAINPLEVEADNEHEAWHIFCRTNGITGSEHSRTIELVDGNREQERLETKRAVA